MSKYLNTQSLLWLALVLAMAGSLKHLTHTFASVDNDYLFGLLQAVSVDCGLFALAYSIKQRKATNRSTKILWAGVVLFTCISVFGNYTYAQNILGVVPGWVLWLKPLVLAASLPLLVLYLAEVVSDNQSHKAPPAEAPRVEDTKPEEIVTHKNLDSTKANKAKKGKVQERRQQVKELVDEGLPQKEIAQQLGFHPNTISSDIKAMNGVAK